MTFSLIIPAPSVNPFLEQCLEKILLNSFQDYEIIVILDKAINKTSPKTVFLEYSGGPAAKRDFAARKAKGEILGFIDDDAYPSIDWLTKAAPHFNDPLVSAVCGPGITPPSDSYLQKVSGWVSSTFLGSGPYLYRFLPKGQREVDDYPSMNFLIRKSDFENMEGFDTSFWPGEDTKLCLDIKQKLQKKIIYDPKVLVYHHRRPVFRKHLEQNGRYGQHRGYFAKIYPETSFRISYFLPSFFAFGILLGGFSFFINLSIFIIYLAVIAVYFLLVLFESIRIYYTEKNLIISLLYIPAIILTHLWYGLKFVQGFLFTSKLKR